MDTRRMLLHIATAIKHIAEGKEDSLRYTLKLMLSSLVEEELDSTEQEEQDRQFKKFTPRCMWCKGWMPDPKNASLCICKEV